MSELTKEEKKQFKQDVNYKRILEFILTLSDDGQELIKCGLAVGSINIKAFSKEDQRRLKSVKESDLNLLIKYYLFNSGKF